MNRQSRAGRVFTRKRFLGAWLGMLGLSGLAWKPKASRFVEFRSYNLKPGTRAHFHDLMVSRSMPLLQKWHIDVVSYGPSLHDEDSYYLVRSYGSLDEWKKTEDAFYGSDEWRKGPREEILAQIDNYTTVVVEMDAHTTEKLRGMKPRVMPG